MAVTEIPKEEIDRFLGLMQSAIISSAPGWVRHDALTGLIDEIAFTAGAPVIDPIKVFQDARFPEATVSIFDRSEDKRDPRNPNPQAGPRKFFVLERDGQPVPGRYSNLKKAERAARRLHDQIVGERLAGLSALRNFGAF